VNKKLVRSRTAYTVIALTSPNHNLVFEALVVVVGYHEVSDTPSRSKTIHKKSIIERRSNASLLFAGDLKSSGAEILLLPLPPQTVHICMLLDISLLFIRVTISLRTYV